jgi:hypothetical protein
VSLQVIARNVASTASVAIGRRPASARRAATRNGCASIRVRAAAAVTRSPASSASRKSRRSRSSSAASMNDAEAYIAPAIARSRTRALSTGVCGVSRSRTLS